MEEMGTSGEAQLLSLDLLFLAQSMRLDSIRGPREVQRE